MSDGIVFTDEIGWHDSDDGERAEWILSLVDASPDRLALIPIHARSMREIDEMEAMMIRAFDIAKLTRPNLGCKAVPGHAGVPGRGARLRDP